MAITQASFKIAHAGASAIIKIEGRANCNSTDGFNQVIDQLYFQINAVSQT